MSDLEKSGDLKWVQGYAQCSCGSDLEHENVVKRIWLKDKKRDLDNGVMVVFDEKFLESWEKPNAFVVRGPRETPVLVAFDEEGKVSNRGASVDAIEAMFPSGLSGDTLILVHVVEGAGTMLVKQLEVNKLLMEGSPVNVSVLIQMDRLDDMAERLRDKYVQKAARLKRQKRQKEKEVEKV